MDNILVVTKKSRLEIYQGLTDEAEKAVMLQEANGMKDMLHEHDTHYASLEKILATIKDAPHDIVQRADISSQKQYRLVIAVGGDGTFIDASHSIRDSTPLFGINSTPWKSAGFFCYGTADEFPSALDNLESVPKTVLSRMHAVKDGIPLEIPILNEVMFRHLHLGSSWWTVKDNGKETLYKYPYLFMVSTPAGMTGGMWGIEGEVLPLDSGLLEYRFVGLRGMPSQYTDRLEISSRTHRGLFQIDGYHIRQEFPYGSKLILSLDAQPLTVIGDLEKKRQEFIEKNRGGALPGSLQRPITPASLQPAPS
ncbi:MAG: NAD(+)/NADH kinase [Nanoarchaeota archaeon]